MDIFIEKLNGLSVNAQMPIYIDFWIRLSILRLYKCSGYNVPDLKEPKEDDFERAVEIVLPYLMSYRGRLASQRQVFITYKISSWKLSF